jgi:hypothetical protein
MAGLQLELGLVLAFVVPVLGEAQRLELLRRWIDWPALATCK